VRPALEKMTGKLALLGPEPERAASFKLFGNLFLMFMTAGVAEVLTLSKALDVKPEEARRALRGLEPRRLCLGARVKRMLGADFDKASWELSMARKDARLDARRGRAPRRPAADAPRHRREMDRYLARGTRTTTGQ
jgi:3-hydroxyisobutyrate dehydrogenase